MKYISPSSLLGIWLSHPHIDVESLLHIWYFITKLKFLLQSTWQVAHVRYL